MRTSQISRRLLRALSFIEGDGRLISMPAKKPKMRCEGVVVQFGYNTSDEPKGLSRQLQVLNVEPPIKSVAQETDLVARTKKLPTNHQRLALRLCLWWGVSVLR